MAGMLVLALTPIQLALIDPEIAPVLPDAPVTQAAAAPPPAELDDLPPDPDAAPAQGTTVTLPAKHHHAPGDPLEGFNRASYELSEALDKAMWRPAAMAYRTVMPKPARDGIRNALNNLGEPVVFANDVLQLKIGRALKTLGRFVINSTLGLGGLIDTARRKPFHLVHHDNSLGDTLGFYGVGPGPYIYVPVLGPTTLRDTVAGRLQGILPGKVYSGVPFNRTDYQIGTMIAGGLDQRAEADDDLRALTADAVDPYATLRSVFLQNRVGEIKDLKRGDDAAAVPDNSPVDPADPKADPAEPPSPLDDPLDDPAAPPAVPPAQP